MLCKKKKDNSTGKEGRGVSGRRVKKKVGEEWNGKSEEKTNGTEGRLKE